MNVNLSVALRSGLLVKKSNNILHYREFMRELLVWRSRGKHKTELLTRQGPGLTEHRIIMVLKHANEYERDK